MDSKHHSRRRKTGTYLCAQLQYLRKLHRRLAQVAGQRLHDHVAVGCGLCALTALGVNHGLHCLQLLTYSLNVHLNDTCQLFNLVRRVIKQGFTLGHYPFATQRNARTLDSYRHIDLIEEHNGRVETICHRWKVAHVPWKYCLKG